MLESKYRRGVNTVEENSFANQMDGGGGAAFNGFNKDSITINTGTFGKNNLCKTCNLSSAKVSIYVKFLPPCRFLSIPTDVVGLLNSLQSQTTKLVSAF